MAVIFAEPNEIAVTFPDSSTLTTSGLLDTHVIVLSLALSGLTTALILSSCPILK